MKKRELNDIRKENVNSLTKKLKELKAKKDKASVDLSSGKETNLATVRNLKRDIAQVSSIIVELTKKEKES